MSKSKELADLRAENARLTRELGVWEGRAEAPTFQCSDCGSTGPFEDVVYPSTPNGPEEYDTRCVECDSLHVEESPRCAFTAMWNRLDAERAEAVARAEMAEARAAALEAALRPFAGKAVGFDGSFPDDLRVATVVKTSRADASTLCIGDFRLARALLAPAEPRDRASDTATAKAALESYLSGKTDSHGFPVEPTASETCATCGGDGEIPRLPAGMTGSLSLVRLPCPECRKDGEK